MKLTKSQVCVYIENEAQLEEARELLEKYGENMCNDETSEISPENPELNNLQKFHDGEWWLGGDKCIDISYVKITLSELETILKDQ